MTNSWIVGASALIARGAETKKPVGFLFNLPPFYIFESDSPETILQILLSDTMVPDRKAQEPIEVLLTRRSEDKLTFSGKLTCPGGKPESSIETPEQVVVREVEEEVGLSFKPLYVLVDPRRLFFSSSINQGFITNLHIGFWQGQIEVQEDEISSYGWYLLEELQKLPSQEFAFAYYEVIQFVGRYCSSRF